jgi:branched-subunit amino acid aminotransferase/4-amino-4-deoxychorismate lyase
MNSGVIETMRSMHGHIPLWEHHLARLLRSGIAQLPNYEDIRSRLPERASRVRLHVTSTGWDVEIDPLGDPWHGLRIGIWPEPFFNPTPAIKSADRTPYQSAWDHREEGCDDMLLLTEEGFVSETTRMNVFWMRDDALHTADSHCTPLAGITRCLVKQWSPWPVLEGRYPLDHLLGASYVFGTNAVRGVVWFKQVGKKRWTTEPELLARFRAQFEQNAYR